MPLNPLQQQQSLAIVRQLGYGPLKQKGRLDIANKSGALDYINKNIRSF
jgi:hypothetical protein